MCTTPGRSELRSYAGIRTFGESSPSVARERRFLITLAPISHSITLLLPLRSLAQRSEPTGETNARAIRQAFPAPSNVAGVAALANGGIVSTLVCIARTGVGCHVGKRADDR
jgi:hypothetical protein